MQKLKLFCLPYAGGSAMIYNKWKEFLPGSLEIRPVELAGRGIRIKDPFYKTVEEAVEDIYNQIKLELNSSPYALFGHSMGAMLVYELYLKIISENNNKPNHLIFSGRGAPNYLISERRKYHLLNEIDFKDKIIKLGGTPPEIFDSPELSQLFVPLLRNDFRLATTDYSLRPFTPFDCNISVCVGKDEDIESEAIHGWKMHTNKLCSVYYFNGGHFFLNSETEKVTRLLSCVLNNTL